MRKFVAERGPTACQRFLMPADVQRPYTIAEALDIFVRAKEAEGVRPRTVKDYRMHIGYLTKFLDERYPDVAYIDDITAEMIREYIRYMRSEKRPYEGVEGREKQQKGLSANTINMRLRTLRTMCRFWFAEGMIAADPMKNIKPVRDDKQEEVPGLTSEEIERILGALNERYYAEWRDKALILLLLDTGLRITEAVSLTADQIDIKRGTLWVPSSVAKNRQGREVPISREVAKMLLELHRESLEYFGPHDQIFMNAYGKEFTADSFRRRLHRLKKKLGIKRLHPHMFRHTFCREYILNGGDIFTLQKIVDHADIKTTRRYIQMDGEHVKAQHNRHSPVRKYVGRRR